MQNIVEFHIIGRPCRIDAAKKVTHVSVATNYNCRKGEIAKSDPQRHRITLFGGLRERFEKATIGDLVRITGRIGQAKYKVEGITQYPVDLIADGFATLVKAKPKTVEDDCRIDCPLGRLCRRASFGIANDRKVVEYGQAAIEKKMAKANFQFVS